MAPREATGTFPDQFLTFDYDTMGMGGGGGGGGGPAPAAHDNAVNNLQGGGPTETEEGDQHAQQNPPLPMHHSLSDRPDSLSSTMETVDPLSIDPTEDEDDDHQHQHHHAHHYPEHAGPALLAGDPSQQHQQQRHHSLVLRLLQQPVPTVESSPADPPTSPLSTGSSFASMLSSSRSHRRPTPPHHRQMTIPFPSVLDTAESDDEDDDNAVPALETTIVSSSSTATSDPGGNNSIHHMMSSPMSTSTRMWSNHESTTVTSANMISEEDLSDILDGNDDDDDDEDNDDDNNDDDDNDNASVDSSDSLRMIYRNTAFDDNEPLSPSSANSTHDNAPPSPNSITLSFGPNTTVADLKYFAERGCIVALLQALTTPRLVTLGARMLADYAKMSHRRVAVASNRRILEFVQRTMLQVSEDVDWPGREYAVETVRSLTATEESDKYLMGTFGLLNSLALVSRGGPFVSTMGENGGGRIAIPLASEKSRLHACIAIMNLSCGKANKIEIARIPDVLEAMRDVMLSTSNEARLKATTCIKNLSNADANDAALLGTEGLLEALGRVAAASCSIESGATSCTTNACLALMNLSISKVNKHRVFRTNCIMESLMTVLERTAGHPASTEARVKACSALSNLAIGYDNKIPMFNFPGFVETILQVIRSDIGEARTKACSILWSFAAEMKNQGPVVARGDILPVLVRVAEEDGTTEARFKCVAALTLLAESLDNAVPLLESGALTPLMEILHDAGPDPTQWKGQTASWCVGFLMNISQSDEAVPSLRDAGVVELLAPLLTLDHYQSLKAAMAVTFCCRYDEGDECYDLLRKTENVIPKIISLLHNTLSGRGGNGYKYGVFTLRSSVGCIDALASGPDFMKERIATAPVFESLLRVIHDFCVDGGTPGAIVGGGRDDPLSATLAVRALYNLTEHLIPMTGSSALPFGRSFDGRVLTALDAFVVCTHPDIREDTKSMASDAKTRIYGGRDAGGAFGHGCRLVQDSDDVVMRDVTSFASSCCGFPGLPGFGEDFLQALALPSLHRTTHSSGIKTTPSIVDQDSLDEEPPVRTFLLADESTGRRFVVPKDPSGGRTFNDTRVWCYRRGRFCRAGEEADPNYVWTTELQQSYDEALARQQDIDSNSSGDQPLVANSFDGLQ